jgi:hypothetical protein
MNCPKWSLALDKSKNYFFLVFLLFSIESIYAQKIVKISGVGEAEFSITISEELAKSKAKEQASINALENAFGTILIDGSTTYVSNVSNGEKTASQSVYNFISNTAVNGEILEVKSEEYKTIQKPVVTGKDTLKVRFIQCNITILAKELVAPPVQFEAFPLGCENKKCKTNAFKDGEDFFFYFNSPVSGYLWIYLDDGKQAQCLLPYSSMPANYEGGFPVKADKEYIFFSNSVKNHNLENLDFTIDTYQLGAEKEQDLNRVFVVFSEKPLAKPKLNDGNEKQLLTDSEINSGFAAPKSTSSEIFQKWLIRNRSYKNTQVGLSILDITITKK